MCKKIFLMASLLTPILFANQNFKAAEKSEKLPAEVIFRHPTLRAKNYKKFLIHPPVIKPWEKDNQLTPEDLQIFTEAFHNAAVKAFVMGGDASSLVTEPGSGVLEINTEIQELQTPKLQNTGEGKIKVKFDGNRRGGSLIVTAIDSDSKKIVIQLKEDLFGPQYIIGDQKKRFIRMLNAFRGWGKVLRMRLEEAQRSG